ncbi:MAG: hypothetical protein HQL52_04615 [Magnetococcales bacterium]|nr:hypothetical protein [Magnetococcales bacterium]
MPEDQKRYVATGSQGGIEVAFLPGAGLIGWFSFVISCGYESILEILTLFFVYLPRWSRSAFFGGDGYENKTNSGCWKINAGIVFVDLICLVEIRLA